MSRMRQVPVMDITQREKAMSRNLPVINIRPASPAVCARAKKPPAAKLRLSDAPGLLSSGCHSVKEVCNHIQHITTDLNQLASSVEHMLPLLSAYVTALQTRGSAPELKEPEHYRLAAKDAEKEPELYLFTPKIPAKPEIPIEPQMTPSPDDLQQLLNNPLVQNMMQSFMQNHGK